LGGFLCRKQAPSSASIGTDAITRAPGSWADAATPAELEEEGRTKEDFESGIKKIRIRGTLAEQEVRRILERALEEWSRDRDLSQIEGTLILVLTVEPDGKVTQAWVQNKEAFEDEALAVLLEKARKLRFSKTRARSHVYVNLSF
jgi:hypothetical protein